MPEFEKVLQAQGSSRARASQMQHAARYHISRLLEPESRLRRKMSERLEEILQRFKDDWDALERELRKFIDELKQGDRRVSRISIRGAGAVRATRSWMSAAKVAN